MRISKTKAIIGTFTLLLIGCSHGNAPKSKKHRFIQSAATKSFSKAGSLFQVEVKTEDLEAGEDSFTIEFKISSKKIIEDGRYELILPEGITTQKDLTGEFELSARSDSKTFTFVVFGKLGNKPIIFYPFRWEGKERRGTPMVWSPNKTGGNADVASFSLDKRTSSKAKKLKSDKFKKLIH